MAVLCTPLAVLPVPKAEAEELLASLLKPKADAPPMLATLLAP